jgi:putative iron-dependent peroxidase
MTSRPQTAILTPLPPAGRFLDLALSPGADANAALRRVATIAPGAVDAIGLGPPLVGPAIAGLRAFPSLTGHGVSIPSSQCAVWAFLGGDDAGELVHRARALLSHLGDAFVVDDDVTAFQYAGGRDLSGFVDGTENPKGEDAVRAAVVSGAGAGLDGSAFVATQRWVHELAKIEKMPEEERDQVIGRRLDGDDELDDAPPTAHVKRSAQESFAPEAFVLRRSMPWGDARRQGLYFVAYGATLDSFERILRRMIGLDDGIVDALFRFTRPVTGGYYWCPPRDAAGRLDLRALGL